MEDIRTIWRRNATVPAAVEECVHHLISNMTQRQPNSPAICAWDGELTYQQLDELSTRLADRLIDLGVGPGELVPLCFEKSMWAPVAMLGVMKAGGASAALDTSLPEERLFSIVQQIGSQLIISSSAKHELASRLSNSAPFMVDRESMLSSSYLLATWKEKITRSAKPSDPLYVVFTSGSTGTPKGVVITHSNFASAAHYQRQFLHFRTDSRVFDFASYSFDASWSNFLHTLTAGGCLCVPSEYDRINRIGESMVNLRANYADLTPSVAELLSPLSMPRLEVLVLGGEPLQQERLSCLGVSKVVINTYGPAECTIIVTGIEITLGGIDNKNIGQGIGSTTWVVDQDNHNRLLPLGSTGELLIEGPLVGYGYLHDTAKTAAAFIDDPPWLLRGGPGVPGRRGRLYKTGDLAHYNADGTLSFVGRKDLQVKIHGRRVELTEIEHHVRQLLPVNDEVQVLAEVVTPHGLSSQVVMVFVVLEGASLLQHEELEEKVATLTAELNSILVEKLPAYMVPSAYIPVAKTPMTPTGKTDRRRLRQIGASSLSRYTPNPSEKTPLTENQTQLARLWAIALGNPDLCFDAGENFFAMGGDSITAMRLVVLARDERILLTVADIFLHPQLNKMVLRTKVVPIAHSVSSIEDIPFQPFGELLATVPQEYVQRVPRVEDIFPCTPLQSALFTLSERDPRLYLGQHWFVLHQTTDIAKFKHAVEQMTKISPILRTVVLPGQDSANHMLLLQAIIQQDSLQWTETNTPLANFLSMDVQKPFSYGDLTTRFALVSESKEESVVTYFVWTSHHAVYDGWSLYAHLKNIDRVYGGMQIPPSIPFKNFVGGLCSSEGEESYWKGQLQDFTGSDFPRLPSSDYMPVTRASLHSNLQISRRKASCFTIGTILRAAWAMTTATYTNTHDVVIGSTLSGRNAIFDGIAEVNGPTFTTVPVRLQPSRQKSVFDFLSEVQKSSAEMMPFEQTGLTKIAKMGHSMKLACDFKSLIVIQPSASFASHRMEEDESFNTFDGVKSHISYSYGLVLECCLTRGGVGLNAIYDPGVLGEQQITHILSKFEDIISQMCKESSTLQLGELRAAVGLDIAKLMAWTRILPDYPGTIHQAISHCAMKASSADAICAWDGKMSHGELDNYSSLLAGHLVRMGVEPERMVLMCMEKSKWTVVSILAILKAGGVYVPLDPCFPEARLRAIVCQTNASVCLTSSEQNESFMKLFPNIVVVEQYFKQAPLEMIHGSWTDVAITPSHAAYTIFTSGSTGEPKGVVVDHKALMHSISEHGRAQGLCARSRSFQFSSLTFDVSLTEILATLLHNGCVCIPSDSDRLLKLAPTITELGANWALLTPSVASTISPDAVPSLKTLVLAGEAMNFNHVRCWSKRLHLINGYGPTESCIFSVINHMGMTEADSTNIGRPTACHAWVVDSTDHNVLLPIGAAGELLIEGPVLARGYLHDVQKTAISFVRNPSWGSICGLTIGTRLYKTGDLVYYNHDGTLTYLGRKDLQVKLHGQRMEISDVESHLRQVLDHEEDVIEVHAAIIKPAATENSHLAAFFRVRQGIDMNDNITAAQSYALALVVGGIKDHMQSRVPRYMVPTFFIPIKSMPMTSAGKLDRKLLVAMASTLTTQELSRFAMAGKAYSCPATDLERSIQDIWSIVLGLDKLNIGRNSHFFGLGGDSLSALRIASIAQAANIPVEVSDVFIHPVLQQLCMAIASKTHDARQVHRDSRQNFPAGGHLASDADIDNMGRQLSIDRDAIEDIYDATSYQSIATVTTLLRTRGNTNYYIFSLHGLLDCSRLRTACFKLFQHHELLRTVFTASRRRALQIVLKAPALGLDEYDNVSDPEAFAKELMYADLKVPIRLGALMTRFSLIQSTKSHNVLYMKVSHAQYDGISLERIRANLENAYSDLPLLTGPRFSEFIHYANSSEAKTFWTDYLKRSTLPQIVNHSGPAYRNLVNCSVRKLIPAKSLGRRGITDSNLIKAAWAYTLARATRNSDIIFAVLVSGRNVPVPEVENIAGPTVNHTPWRVQLQDGWTVLDLLQNVQHQQVLTMPHESTYFRQIIEECTDWPKWARFTSIVHHMTILDISSMKLEDTDCKIWTHEPGSDRTDVWVRSKVVNGTFDILLHSNKEVVPQDIIEALLNILCETVLEFAADPDAPLKDPLTLKITAFPSLPLQTLPPRQQIEEIDFDNSVFRELVERGWKEIMCVDDEKFKSQDITVTPNTPFFDLWGNMLAAQQFAEFYSDNSISVLLEDIMEYPTMKGQVALLERKYEQRIGSDHIKL